MGKFLFEVAASSFRGSYDLVAFEQIVRSLAAFNDFKRNHTVFYTVRGLVDLNSKLRNIGQVDTLSPGIPCII